MRTQELVAGFFLGAGIVLLLLGLLLHHYAASIETTTWNNTLSNYTELLSLAEKLINEVKTSNITVSYAELVKQLPSIEKVVKDYQAIYEEAEKNKQLLVQAYIVTHSQDYNETIAQLEKLSSENNTIISIILGPLLQRLANYMKQAQPLTTEALEVLKAMEKNPPQKIRAYLSIAERIVKEMPPDKLNKTLLDAQKLITRAKKVLNSTTTWEIQGYRQSLENYSYSAIIAGTGMITASAIILYALWRRQ